MDSRFVTKCLKCKAVFSRELKLSPLNYVFLKKTKKKTGSEFLRKSPIELWGKPDILMSYSTKILVQQYRSIRSAITVSHFPWKANLFRNLKNTAEGLSPLKLKGTHLAHEGGAALRKPDQFCLLLQKSLITF